MSLSHQELYSIARYQKIKAKSKDQTGGGDPDACRAAALEELQASRLLASGTGGAITKKDLRAYVLQNHPDRNATPPENFKFLTGCDDVLINKTPAQLRRELGSRSASQSQSRCDASSLCTMEYLDTNGIWKCAPEHNLKVSRFIPSLTNDVWKRYSKECNEKRLPGTNKEDYFTITLMTLGNYKQTQVTVHPTESVGLTFAKTFYGDQHKYAVCEYDIVHMYYLVFTLGDYKLIIAKGRGSEHGDHLASTWNDIYQNWKTEKILGIQQEILNLEAEKDKIVAPMTRISDHIASQAGEKNRPVALAAMKRQLNELQRISRPAILSINDHIWLKVLEIKHVNRGVTLALDGSNLIKSFEPPASVLHDHHDLEGYPLYKGNEWTAPLMDYL